jgi:tRNA G18 (ribose-2'-O)-methylase SpoU
MDSISVIGASTMSMSIRQLRKRMKDARQWAIKRFEKQRRANLMAAPGPHEYIIVLDRLQPQFNIGKIFRSADAFGAREVHLIGIDFFDPAPGMGSFKWVPARFHDDFGACYQDLCERGYSMFALEPGTDQLITTMDVPRKSAFILGHEEFGLSFDPSSFPDINPVTIPQTGRVQSLNVSVAASVVMYEYVRRYGGGGENG